MALILHTAPGSYQIGDDYQNSLCCSDLDFVLCYHSYIVDLDFSEWVLIVDYLSTVGNGMAVAGIELQRCTDKGNTT